MKEINLFTEFEELTKITYNLNEKFNYFNLKKSNKQLNEKILRDKFINTVFCVFDLNIYEFLIEKLKIYGENLLSEKGFDVFDIYATRGSAYFFNERNENYTHKFTPNNDYLAIGIDLYVNGEIKYTLRLSPYIGEFKQYEVHISFKCPNNNIQGTWLLKGYNKVQELIKENIPTTNLGTDNLYMHVFASKLANRGLSNNCSSYNEDCKKLKEYAKAMNKEFEDLNLSCVDGIFSWNKDYKLKDVVSKTEQTIKFPILSSFIYE